MDLDDYDKADLVTEVRRLRAATRVFTSVVDDLWGCMDKDGIDAVQPDTIVIASAAHTEMWHQDEFMPGTSPTLNAVFASSIYREENP